MEGIYTSCHFKSRIWWQKHLGLFGCYSLDKCGIKKNGFRNQRDTIPCFGKRGHGWTLWTPKDCILSNTEVSRIKRSVTNLQRSISSFPKPKYILQNCSIFQKLLKNIASKQGPNNYAHHCIAEFSSLMIPFILQNLK